MSIYTNFLKLRKPDETEKYTVNHFNANADLIDSALARMEQKNVSQDNLLASKSTANSIRITTKRFWTGLPPLSSPPGTLLPIRLIRLQEKVCLPTTIPPKKKTN